MQLEDKLKQLFHALQDGDAGTIQTLLEAHPALSNSENQDGLTPLGYASHYGQAVAARILLEHGADVNAISHSNISFIPSNTALHAAFAGERSPEVIQLLLKHGASTTILDSDGQTALHSAAFHTDQAELVELLLQYHADPSALNSAGVTAEDIALERGHMSVASCLQKAATARPQS